MKNGGNISSGFLNVDLEVESRAELVPLIQALSASTVVLASFRRGRRYLARFELAVQPRTPAHGIRAFGRLIRRLPARVRRLWNGATRRDLDIGVETSVRRREDNVVLSRKAVQEAAELSARILVTVYQSNGRGRRLTRA